MQVLGPRERAEADVGPACGRGVRGAARAELVAESVACGGIGQALLETCRSAVLDPQRHLDQQPRRRPFVWVRVERDVEAVPARVVDKSEQLFGTAGVTLTMIEVSD